MGINIDSHKIWIICLTVIVAIFLWNKVQQETQQQNICIQYCLPELSKRQTEASNNTAPIQEQMDYCRDSCSTK